MLCSIDQKNTASILHTARKPGLKVQGELRRFRQRESGRKVERHGPPRKFK